MKMYIETFCDGLRDNESHCVTWNDMLNTVTAAEIWLFSLLHLFLKARDQLWPIHSSMRRPRSVKGYHFYHSGWESFSVQETKDDGDDAGTGETFASGASSCESACEDASGASETAGAPAYCAMLDSPVWMSGGVGSPYLQERGGRAC